MSLEVCSEDFFLFGVKEPDLRIKEIAHQLGFGDVYYFSRMFTKVMGLSPRQFRQGNRA